MTGAGLQLEQGTALAGFTTLRVGGAAERFARARSIDDIVAASKLAWERGWPLHVLGGGSNVVIGEGPLDGLTLRIHDPRAEARLDGDSKSGAKVTAFAGHSLIALAFWASRQGLQGLEWAAGIPGNVGGALWMNAGAHGHELGEFVESATIVLPGGEVRTLQHDAIGFAYRHTGLPQDALVAEVTFRLQPGDSEALLAEMHRLKEWRHETQPWTARTAGCFFRNPEGDSAGRLIDAAGLKGLRVGDAEVSAIHANFFVNRGHATPEDIRRLVAEVRRRVAAATGISLRLEVVSIAAGIPIGGDDARERD